MKPAEVCRKAAEVIRTHGWRQGSYGECDGPVCALGAINTAYGGHPYGVTSIAAVNALIDHLGPKCRNGVAFWNDTPGRTASEVIAALEETARRLEGQP